MRTGNSTKNLKKKAHFIGQQVVVLDWPNATLWLCHMIYIKNIYVFLSCFEIEHRWRRCIAKPSIELLSKNRKLSIATPRTKTKSKLFFIPIWKASKLFAQFSRHSDMKMLPLFSMFVVFLETVSVWRKTPLSLLHGKLKSHMNNFRRPFISCHFGQKKWY